MNYQRKVTIGNATLYLGDGYEIAPQLSEECDVVTDPQYKFNTSGGGHMRKARKCLEDIRDAGLDKGFDHRVLNPLLYKSVVVFCHNDQVPELSTYLKGSFEQFCIMDWKKNNPPPFANKHYQPDKEFFIHAWNRGGHPVGSIKNGDLKRSVTTNNGKSKYYHPTVKPLEVMLKIVRNMGGNTILDMFMGTGTTGVAALQLGKSFIGIEHNEKYFDIACERISEVAA